MSQLIEIVILTEILIRIKMIQKGFEVGFLSCNFHFIASNVAHRPVESNCTKLDFSATVVRTVGSTTVL